METAQDFSQHNEDGQQTFEDFERKKAEDTLAAFFGDYSEEEQNILREFGSKFNIRSNDAIWAVAGIFLIFGRFCNKLPQRISNTFDERQQDIIDTVKKSAAEFAELETQKAQSSLADNLSRISQEIINQNKKKMWLYEFFLPLSCACCGVFCLCLISFVGGAAIAGKGWGHSPLEALLNAPAGWIIPLALIPVGGVALYKGLTEQGKSRYLNLVAALIMAALVVCVLPYIL